MPISRNWKFFQRKFTAIAVEEKAKKATTTVGKKGKSGGKGGKAKSSGAMRKAFVVPLQGSAHGFSCTKRYIYIYICICVYIYN